MVRLHLLTRHQSALASVSDAITRLQEERDRLQTDRDEWKHRYVELHQYYGNIMKEKDDEISSYLRKDLQISENLDHALKQVKWYQSGFEAQASLIKSLQDELEEEAEFDWEEDPKMRRIRREYDRRVNQCEDRMAELQKDMQKKIDKHIEHFWKIAKEHDADLT